jgi:hypothetical protein
MEPSFIAEAMVLRENRDISNIDMSFNQNDHTQSNTKNNGNGK